MKSVLLSIHPKWCRLIASGKKTVEIRKTEPKIETPFKCYIYCTLSGSKELFSDTLKEDVALWNREKWYERKGKVIGEFVCRNIDEHTLDSLIVKEDAEITLSGSCLTKEETLNYLNYVRGTNIYRCRNYGFYGWHISNLVIYDNPKELSEFFVYCDRCDKRPISCEFAYEENNENGYYSECMCDFKRPIKRPPQSWCYVNDLEG